MNERIILAPGLNGNELIKNLTLHGVNCFNTRIVSAGELARIALMRSGIPITEEFIDPVEETGLIAEAVKDNPYFKQTSYADLRNLSAAVRRMRCLVADTDESAALKDTLSKGIFMDKNNALLSVYENYIQLLSDSNSIDSVLLIRKAIAECGKIDSEFIILDEYPLDPLTDSLLQKLSGGSFSRISIKELYGVSGKPLVISGYKNCYGTSNEVETIINDIYAGKKLDQCTVAITDAGTYSQLFLDYSLLYNIPVTFGCGVPIINSYPAKLLSLYYRWMTSGFFGAEALDQMLSGGYFDRSKLKETLPEQDEDFEWRVFYECLGDIKFTNDKSINAKRLEEYKQAMAEDAKYIVEGESKEYQEFTDKQKCIPLLEIMADELAMPVESFIAKYAVLRQQNSSVSGTLLAALDKVAVSTIFEIFSAIRRSGVSRDEGDIIANVLETNILSQKSEPGYLHVTGVDKAMSSVRETLYIAGLSASKYPGSPKENYLLLDSDIRLFGDCAESFTSEGGIIRKNDTAVSLAELASALGAEIFISYSGFNVSDLKKDNASSLIYKLYSRTGSSISFEDSIQTVEYFEPAISGSRLVGQSYVNGISIGRKDVNYDSVEAAWNIDKEYSPSALEDFWGCPRSFLLGRILRIPEPDDDDQFTVIDAKDRGTLAHSVMEQLANSDMTLDEFLVLSGEFFDRYIKEHPPLIAEKVSSERDLFLEMMATAYRGDPHRKVVLKEEDIHCEHESGVKLHGFPDRVEELEDGTYLIVDYKTGGTVRHVEDDINTCLQVVIYAYLMESKGYKVSGGEYRYIRLNRTVKCTYDDDMRSRLNTLLEKFKEMMLKGYFPCGSSCDFCKFDSICGKSVEEDIWPGSLPDDSDILGGD